MKCRNVLKSISLVFDRTVAFMCDVVVIECRFIILSIHCLSKKLPHPFCKTTVHWVSRITAMVSVIINMRLAFLPDVSRLITLSPMFP